MMVLGPLLTASVVVCLDLWVLADARRRARQGTPVVFRFGSLTIGTPEAWAIACLLVFVIFIPIYWSHAAPKRYGSRANTHAHAAKRLCRTMRALPVDLEHGVGADWSRISIYQH